MQLYFVQGSEAVWITTVNQRFFIVIMGDGEHTDKNGRIW